MSKADLGGNEAKCWWSSGKESAPLLKAEISGVSQPADIQLWLWASFFKSPRTHLGL